MTVLITGESGTGKETLL
ncbi:MAG: sigma-54 factor interaction domain-containing protein [Bacteroidales bacterium]|nr:sigma-54 factor interaction domain-containing protein [Bacteroidales bacterium]